MKIESSDSPKLYIIDGVPYYPAGVFERDMEILLNMIQSSNRLPYISFGLSVVSLAISIAALAH